MPIYEYECSECSHRFEVKQGFNDNPQAKCPRCKEIARRVFHPTPIIFKGSGFYVTDHRPSAKDKKPETSKGESETSKGESKTSKGESETSKGESKTSKSSK